MSIQWFSSDVALSGRLFTAFKSVCLPWTDCEKAVGSYRARAELGEAVFVRRLPSVFRPLDKDHPEHGYVSDDDPDRNEIWRVKRCSLEDSVLLALAVFEAPAFRCFRDPGFERSKIVRFLQSFEDLSGLALNFVGESHLEFRFDRVVEGVEEQVVFHRISAFKRLHFLYEGNSEEDGWQWHLFQMERVFSLGVV